MHNLRQYLHFLHNRELDELYLSLAISGFSISIIAVFIPIYLLNLGYSLTAIFQFFLVVAMAHAGFMIPSAKISSRFGFKHAILFSAPLLIVFYLLLYSLESMQWPLFVLGLVLGVRNSLFWMGYHTDFAKFSEGKKRGSEVGVAMLLFSFASVSGPLIGGILLVTFGFDVVFLMVSGLIFLSVLPLFFSKDTHQPITFSLRTIFPHQRFRDFLSFMGKGIETAASVVIWPLFIFTILADFTALGFVTSLSLFFSLLSIAIVGLLADKNRRMLLRLGSVVNGAVWFVRGFVKTATHIFAIDALYGITKSLIIIPSEAMSYDKANKKNIIEFTLFREMSIHFGRMILYTFLILTGSVLFGVFGGGVGSLLYLFF